jgi:hypothetical protein
VSSTTTERIGGESPGLPVIHIESAKSSVDATDWYEDCDVVVFEDFEPDGVDFEYLQELKILPEMSSRAVKKLKPDQLGFIRTIADDPDYAMKQVARLNDAMESFVASIFRTYEIRRKRVWMTWRLTATGPEDVHYDNYQETEHLIRSFINIDGEPRIWSVSEKLDHAVKRVPLEMVASSTPGTICGILTRSLDWDSMPMIHVSLPPRAVWLVNSQVVAHQIVSGRAMVSYVHWTRDGILDQEKTFKGRAERVISNARERLESRP